MSDGHFERLDPDECARLLRSVRVGRVAFTGADGLTVLPLSHLVHDGSVVLRTAEGTQLARLPDGTPVAYQVDEFDPEYANGWSVLLRGSIRRLAPGELAEGVAEPAPFVSGDRRVLLAIGMDDLSGRAVSAD